MFRSQDLPITKGTALAVVPSVFLFVASTMTKADDLKKTGGQAEAIFAAIPSLHLDRFSMEVGNAC
ncbi:hypothetical protein [Roseibium aggregatum]|uniref:Uncharacterized protein n=1 Tax=Roseibium aggregatum TaxID=187304 RepID=A0A926NRW8_9HYPH|nr:hypothetical protein [Roseibium aggregatum]MBD1546252.1 hypothetical protein [Roseibium aggregatum]